MSVDAAALGIDRLSVADRLELIEQIWDSLPPEVAPDDIPPWHLDVIAKRLANDAARPELGRPWREVLDELKRR